MGQRNGPFDFWVYYQKFKKIVKSLSGKFVNVLRTFALRMILPIQNDTFKIYTYDSKLNFRNFNVGLKFYNKTYADVFVVLFVKKL